MWSKLNQRGEVTLTLALIGLFVALFGVGLGAVSVRQTQTTGSNAQMLPGDFPYRSVLEIRDENLQTIPWEPGMTWTNNVTTPNSGPSTGDIKDKNQSKAILTWNTGSVPQNVRDKQSDVTVKIPGYTVVGAFCTSTPKYICDNAYTSEDGLTMHNIKIESGADVYYGFTVRKNGTSGAPAQPSTGPTIGTPPRLTPPPVQTGTGNMEVKVVALNYPQKTRFWSDDSVASGKPGSCSRQNSGEERPLYLSSFTVIATCVGGGCQVGGEPKKVPVEKRMGHGTFVNLPVGDYTLDIEGITGRGFHLWEGCQDKIFTVKANQLTQDAIVMLENEKDAEYETTTTEKICTDDGGVPNLIQGQTVFCYFPNGQQQQPQPPEPQPTTLPGPGISELFIRMHIIGNPQKGKELVLIPVSCTDADCPKFDGGSSGVNLTRFTFANPDQPRDITHSLTRIRSGITSKQVRLAYSYGGQDFGDDVKISISGCTELEKSVCRVPVSNTQNTTVDFTITLPGAGGGVPNPQPTQAQPTQAPLPPAPPGYTTLLYKVTIKGNVERGLLRAFPKKFIFQPFTCTNSSCSREDGGKYAHEAITFDDPFDDREYNLGMVYVKAGTEFKYGGIHYTYDGVASSKKIAVRIEPGDCTYSNGTFCKKLIKHGELNVVNFTFTMPEKETPRPTGEPSVTKAPVVTTPPPSAPTGTQQPRPTVVTPKPQDPTPTPNVCKHVKGNGDAPVGIVILGDGFATDAEFESYAVKASNGIATTNISQYADKLRYVMHPQITSKVLCADFYNHECDEELINKLALECKMPSLKAILVIKKLELDEGKSLAGFTNLSTNPKQVTIPSHQFDLSPGWAFWHELGHALPEPMLFDEYVYENPSVALQHMNPPFLKPAGPNCSQVDNKNECKWGRAADCIEGCMYKHWYKPSEISIMNRRSSPFTEDQHKFNAPSLEAWKNFFGKYGFSGQEIDSAGATYKNTIHITLSQSSEDLLTLDGLETLDIYPLDSTRANTTKYYNIAVHDQDDTTLFESQVEKYAFTTHSEAKPRLTPDFDLYLPYYLEATKVVITNEAGTEVLTVDLQTQSIAPPTIPDPEALCGNTVCDAAIGEDENSCRADCGAHLAKSEPERADFDHNGVINGADLSYLLGDDVYQIADLGDVDGDTNTNAIDYTLTLKWMGFTYPANNPTQ